MDQREFNRSMDSYIKRRKSPSSSSPIPGKGLWETIKEFFSVESRPEPEPKPADDSVSMEDVEAVMRGERVQQDEQDENFDEEAFVEAHKPKGFFESLKEAFFGSYKEDELLGEDEPDVAVIERPGAVDDDVKEMLRTCVSWINRLPAEEISRIKRSAEYDEFKDLLKKYKLIKE